MNIDPRAGQPAKPSDLVDVSKLIEAYYQDQPDPRVPAQRVIFGTSGHRGSSFDRSFNEWHILAITQAICLYRQKHNIGGPLFLGIDTHALSKPAFDSAVEVLAGNGIQVMLTKKDQYTPTPVISHAILRYNRDRTAGMADGIVITPSHNPPEWGGFKYNPPHGGPAEESVTTWIQDKANQLLIEKLSGVKRVSTKTAVSSPTMHRHDYMDDYVKDLANVIDFDTIRSSGVTIGVDPLGGAGVHYWPAIAEHYHLPLHVVNDAVDPTFRFMTLDWDGRIRMDPSSKYAMQALIGMKDKYDISVACDTDHDRHGIVTRSGGLLPPNHYLAVCAEFLVDHRPQWGESKRIGKTVVSSSMIDRVARKLTAKLYEVPVGFKYFVDGLLHGRLGFAGEESAGSSFLRHNGSVWTTDKDGIIAALLAAEMTAKRRQDPAQLYRELSDELGESWYERTQAVATSEQRGALAVMNRESVTTTTLAGEKILSVLTNAPGDGNPIGGIKIVAQNGWFAARPSGTEAIYKIYAESFSGQAHLKSIQDEAEAIVNKALGEAIPAASPTASMQLQETR